MTIKHSKIRYYSSVVSKEVEWLWYPYIPYGRVTVIQGDLGEGKTTFVLGLAARLTAGQSFPECEISSPPQNEINKGTEDGIADTIKPRLIVTGANCKRVAFIDDTEYPLTLDDERLEHAICECNARLLVLDPFQAFIGTDADMHRANDMRPLMHKLSEIAKRTRCAVVTIGHRNKASGTKSLHRSLGSIDITAAARSVLLIGRIKDDPMIRVMTQIKSNLAPEGRSVAFEIMRDGSIRWIGYYEIAADDLLSGASQTDDSKLSQARALLHEAVAQGPISCIEGYSLCKKNGIGKRTTETAKRLENIKSTKISEGWYWEIGGDDDA